MNRLLSVIRLTLLLVLIPSLRGQAPISAAQAQSQLVISTQETVVVPFTSGTIGVSTTQSYSGNVAVTVSGTGQAAGTQWSDAFYIYTDSSGQPITPWHPTDYYNWSLWINELPVDSFLASIPSYDPTHIYSFTISVPTGYINFAVGDLSADDNTGSYVITLTPTSPPSPVIDLRIDQDVIYRGECTTLRWDVDNVRAVYLDEQGVPGHGTQQVCPQATTTYTLRVVTYAGDIHRTVTVTVLEPPQVEISFTADGYSILLGQCTTLRWDVENVQAVYLDGQGVPGHGTQRVCPQTTTTYSLRVVTNTGDTSPTITVTVVSPPTEPPEIVLEDFTLADQLKSFSVMQRPVVFKPNVLWLKITNKGGSRFDPPSGKGNYSVQVMLKQPGVGRLEEYHYVTLQPLSLVPLQALDPEESQNLQITDVFFFNAIEDGELEVLFQPDRALNLQNSALSKRIAISPHPDNAWNCAALITKAFVLAANVVFPQTLGVSAAARALANMPTMFLKWQACGSDVKCGATAIVQYLISVIGTVPGQVINLLADITSYMRTETPACLSWIDYINAIVREFIRNKVRINAIGVQSPAYILVTNTSGQSVGFLDDGSLVQEIPDARAVKVDEDKLVLFPADNTVTIRVKGIAYGMMKLNLELTNQNGTPMSASYPNIPINATTIGTLDSANSSLALMLDDNGDGVIDRIVHPVESPGEASIIETPTQAPAETPTPHVSIDMPTQTPSSSNDTGISIVVLLAIIIIIGGAAGFILVRRQR